MSAKSDCSSTQLEELRELVLGDKELTSRTDDIFLLNFLRARKYDTERAFQLIKNYYSTRKRYPEIFNDLKPSAIKKCLDAKIGGFLIMKEDFVLGVGIANRWDPVTVHFKDILRHVIMELDCMLKDDLLGKNKITVIMDFSGLNWQHCIQVTPRAIYQCIYCLYNSYPARYKEFHIVNENKFLHALLSMALPILPKKLKSRIHLHGSSFESLRKFIKRENLPAEYGGDLPPLDLSDRIEILRANETFFVANEKFWSIEKTT